ncbi:MAG: hypothetical protein SGBAC_012471, partial [Bacillariaceae sp.]
VCSGKPPTTPQKHVDKDYEKIEGIPDGLQDWAHTSSVGAYYRRENPRKGFVHLTDGRTFFIGSSFNETEYNDTEGDPYAVDYPENILFSAGPNGTLTRYANVHEPSNGFISIAGESEEKSESFCCTFQKHKRSEMIYYRGHPSTEILCLSSGEDISEVFRNTTLIPGEKRETKGRYLRSSSTKAFAGQLWYAASWQYDIDDWSMDSEEAVTEFLRLDPETMEVETVANISKTRGGRHDVPRYDFAAEDECGKTMSLLSLSSLVVVLPVSLYVLIKKRMGAGIVPLALATCFIVMSFDEDVLAMMCVILVLCTTISLILRRPKCFNREMMVHLHYTLVFFAMFGLMDRGRFSGVVVTGLALLAAMVLNHPILQIIGWIGGLGGALFLMMAASNPRSFGPFVDEGQAMILVPVCIVVGFGVVSIGTLLKRYRAYIVFYSSRLWALIRNAETNEMPPGPPGATDVQGDEDRTLIT